MTELPKWQSDGYRHETCPMCNHRIGYAKFHAERLVRLNKVVLIHDADCTAPGYW